MMGHRRRVIRRCDPATARLLVTGRLRTWRRCAELSQTQLAEVCGVSRATVQRWEDERSASGPTVAQMMTAAQAVGDRAGDVLAYFGGAGGGACGVWGGDADG